MPKPTTGPQRTTTPEQSATPGGSSGPSADQWRVEFDIEVTFSNGGALQAQGFRLDIPGTDVGDDELGELFVRHLGLLMVGSTVISNKRLIAEPHKGSRDVPVATMARRTWDLTSDDTAVHTIGEPRLVDLVDQPAIVVRTLGSHDTVVRRVTLAPYDVAGKAVVLHTGGAGRLADDAARWLRDEGITLLATDARQTGTVEALLADRGIPVVTGLAALEALPAGHGLRLHVVPVRSGPSPLPARVFGVVDGH